MGLKVLATVYMKAKKKPSAARAYNSVESIPAIKNWNRELAGAH